MPTYIYKCKNSHFLEEVRKINDNQRTTVCPDCKEDLRPVYYAPAMHLVGKGFYSNGG